MAETVVITGATSGVGRAVVRAFARDGCLVLELAKRRGRVMGLAAAALGAALLSRRRP
jgi:NAD(P)-dependent dehydrogenase (short-subunit alcohol dehydrogenase family)